MFTSPEKVKKHLLIHLTGTLFFALLGAVYELFGHGVYSYHMIYAFAFPLVLGVVPCTVMLLKEISVPLLSLRLLSSAVAVATLGSTLQGVLDIFGTTNSKIIAFIIASGVLLPAAVASAVVTFLKKR